MTEVLVTGAGGFIGSWVCQKLVDRGFKVRALCRYTSSNSIGWLESYENKSDINFFFGDITDKNVAKKAIPENGYIINMAALIGIPYSYEAPESYVNTNIKGALNYLNESLSKNIKGFIQTSTSETYGTAQYVPIDENHPLVGQSPYSASKISADHIAISFWKSFDVPVTIIRPFNTYGPRQSTRAVIPTVITQIVSGNKEIKLGKLSPTRDFNFVNDTCSAFIHLLNCEDSFGRIINSASNFEISIQDTVNLISDVMNTSINVICDEERIRPKSSEVERLFGDNTLLKKLTGWNPEFAGLEGFRKGLTLTAEWFSNPSNLKKYPSVKYFI